MSRSKTDRVYSGASPRQVAHILRPLVDFQEEGMPLDSLEDLLLEKLVPHLMRYDHPGFLSMFNFFPEKGAELGAALALKFNQGVTSWQVSPGGAVLEELCCQALCRLFGLGPEAEATFMYSGTYANQQALYMALHRKAGERGFNLAEKGIKGFGDPSRLKVLASREAHFSLRQAVRMLGLGEESLVPLEVDSNRRLDTARLVKRLPALGDGADIICLVATAGTTSTGSVDPILPAADIAGDLGTWLHVDGAYGLAYGLVPEWRPLFQGLDRADSVSWDPHKQFGVPIPNSVLFVRDRSEFRRMAVHGHYFNRQNDPMPNPGLKSPPTTRPLAALPLVTTIRHLGLKEVIRRLRAPLQAVRELARALEEENDVEAAHIPDTGILCFRMVPKGLPGRLLDALQEFIYERIMAGGRRTISLSRLDDKAVLRLVALSPDVTAAAMMETVREAREIAEFFRD
jgi:L-2,4-diaminobutyrate decarboxylase